MSAAIAREALVLQKTARPQIDWRRDIPERGPVAPCDRRHVAPGADQPAAERGRRGGRCGRRTAAPGRDRRAAHVAVDLADEVRITVTDDGVGLPQEDRGRLTEPYVTHKPKGTGLGLAIVKKIMEDHGGRLMLDDRPDGPGRWPPWSCPR